MECLLLITQQDQYLVRTGIALRIVKSDAQRHHHRLFCVLSRCGRDGLLQPQGSTAALPVMFNHRLHEWRTGLLIPEPQLCEVETRPEESRVGKERVSTCRYRRTPRYEMRICDWSSDGCSSHL